MISNVKDFYCKSDEEWYGVKEEPEMAIDIVIKRLNDMVDEYPECKYIVDEYFCDII